MNLSVRFSFRCNKLHCVGQRRGLAANAAFLSDNVASVPSSVLASIRAASGDGPCPAYGSSGDNWSQRAHQAIVERLFDHGGSSTRRLAVGEGDDAGSVDAPGADGVFFVWGGTGANVVALATLVEPYSSVLCASVSHLNGDECGAPERFLGVKLVPVTPSGPAGKLRPDDLKPFLRPIGDHHCAQPTVLSLTQATEYGGVYDRRELADLVSVARDHGLKVHVDGARLANASVAAVDPHNLEDACIASLHNEATAGADVISLGATKNGLMFGEAVVLRRSAGARAFERAPFVRKQATQLCSKQRFIAAQFLAYCDDANDVQSVEGQSVGGLKSSTNNNNVPSNSVANHNVDLGLPLWFSNALNANLRAAELVSGLQLLGIELTQVCEANLVFCAIPVEVRKRLESRWQFYVWTPFIDAEHDEIRLCCSFETSSASVNQFLSDLKKNL